MAAAALILAGCTSHAIDTDPTASPSATSSTPQAQQAAAIAEAAFGEFDLRALLVKITVDGQDVYEAAFGESMTGVPATTEMNFRNGAFAFTYIGQAFARMADEGLVSLDDTIGTWLPDLPESNRVTIYQLLTMTSGYPDYVRQEAILDGTQADPFRAWTDDELIEIGLAPGMLYEPGTNWSYSHTNYVILGQLLTAITGQPVHDVLEEYVMGPMGLTQTGSNANTPAIPEPVLHSFSAERREFLQVPDDVPFNEETTYWNPSWTTASGAVQTSTIDDVTRSMEIVGSGAQVSPEMYDLQMGEGLLGLGEPTDACPLCRTMVPERRYGLGVILYGDWVAQTKAFAGSAATGAYLPQEGIAITVVATFLPEAFQDAARYSNTTALIFERLATLLAPDFAPQVLPPS